MSDYPSTEQILSEVSAESKPAETQTPEAQQAPQPSWQEDEYEVDGKRVKETREMILKRASLGYHAAQKLEFANKVLKENEGYKAKIPEYETRLQKLQRWQEYNDYAEQNPDWARHVEESWNARANMQQSTQDQQPQYQIPPEVQQTLAELKAFRDETLTARQQEQIQAEDKQFDEEIRSVAEKHGVDMSLADEQGRSLEWRVLEHMKAMGLDGSKAGHFRSAFRDYYFDNLAERQREQVKEREAKTLEERRKAGILDVSRTPKSSRPFNPVNHSYNELGEMALADLLAAKKA